MAVQQDRTAPEEGPGETGAESSFGKFYNASQVRADSWNRLKALTARLCRAQVQGRDTEALSGQIRETLAGLAHFESYWAFPGRAAFGQLGQLLERVEGGDGSGLPPQRGGVSNGFLPPHQPTGRGAHPRGGSIGNSGSELPGHTQLLVTQDPVGLSNSR